ncbi:MAG: ATP-grasp domain-containing protein, partial [Candidatus Cloacimonetes bacterium]|nr:ATP-grasp domain-containing protein [Candidatus Cloacimonadota bacterium]
ACALSMDKFITKLIAQSEGIPVPEALIFREKLLDEYQDIKDFDAIGARLALPLVVKPNDAGSSVGISIVHRMEDLKSAVSEAFKYSNSVLLEQFIPGRELTVTVLAGEALPVVEIAPKNGWYDYKSKYTKGTTDYTAPALIDEAEALLLQVYAVRLWKALECEGYARFDFRYDGQRSYFLEVNTLPGMTPLSLTPMAAKAQGFTFGELLDKIIKEVRTDIKWRKP